jgi:hypothetical protein
MNFVTAEKLEQQRQVHDLQALWQELFPDLPKEESPYQSRLKKWLELAGLEICDYAIRRAARKRYAAQRDGRPMSAGQIRRYAELVVQHEVAGDREQWATEQGSAQ